ncbi:MAG: hypothetical protein ACM3KM_01825, partial [Acidobacteriaceae bacterium]
QDKAEMKGLSDNFVVQRPPKNIPKKLESLITQMALDANNNVECEDLGLVKIRVDKDLNPNIISIDPSPSLHPKGPLAAAAELVGWQYSDLIEEIMRITTTRYKNQ